MKYTLAILVLAFCITTGCNTGPAQPPPPLTEVHPERTNLPSDIEIVEDLGNGWFIYKMEVLGEIRWYKARVKGDYSGETSWAQQSVTEIRPPATYYGYPK